MSDVPVPIRVAHPQLAPATVRRIEHHILAFTAVIAHHVVLMAGGAALLAIAGYAQITPLPRQPPLLLLVVSLVLAHCSLMAIWWSRFKWPYHVKTVIAVLGCGGLWTLLAGTLKVCHYHPIAAASWAAAMGTQLASAAIASLILESVVYRPRATKRPQFNIMYLILWTTVVAALLGGGRWLSKSWGWSLAEFLGWEFTIHLQLLGVTNAVLVIGVMFSTRLKSSWAIRLAACALTIGLVCVLGPLALFESQRGPTIADLVWLLGYQGLFLVATLVPLEIAREKNCEVEPNIQPET